MAENTKTFIGKVTVKEWPDGGMTLKLALSDKDKALIAGPGYANIELKKSKAKGTWYGELVEARPMPTPQTSYQPAPVDDSEPLPF